LEKHPVVWNSKPKIQYNMPKSLIFLFVLILVFSSCGSKAAEPKEETDIEESSSVLATTPVVPDSIIDPEGKTVKERFSPPSGYQRREAEEGSFAQYLQNLPLKAQGSAVYYYDGRRKANEVQAAVIDMDVGKRDLQQCADAIMRLRAEYLYEKQAWSDIHFNFTNGFEARYDKWKDGYRIRVDGNRCNWVGGSPAGTGYASFRKYLDMVFSYAGTLSLSKELPRISLEEIRIGDIFIRGGSPGHAVIIVDMAVHTETGEKLFLLAQSYMPAQDIHVLINPADEDLSPWYRIPESGPIYTPEWTFQRDELARF
jgi:hypothetical protein